MERQLLLQHWHSLVRKFKDEEQQLNVNPRDAEEVTNFLLDYIEYDNNKPRRFRQYNLFTQKRGEEFEKLFVVAEERGYLVDSLRRFIEDDDRWATALEMAER